MHACMFLLSMQKTPQLVETQEDRNEEDCPPSRLNLLPLSIHLVPTIQVGYESLYSLFLPSYFFSFFGALVQLVTCSETRIVDMT
jgi:hypothetical protein